MKNDSEKMPGRTPAQALGLCIPETVLEQHAIWLGKTRAGKSSSMRHVVEWLLERNQRLCVVDPKGDWYGLKLSADGKSPGYPVILFGDFKEPTASDMPINDRSGRHMAELIVSGNRPCVIGMRGWSNAAQSRFWVEFAAALFNSRLADGLKLFVDEVQNFAPKERTGIGQENEALGWTKRLLSEGSGLGLTIFCGSQRPASVHNGVLTQCETLVAMRVIHASDRKAAEEWIKGSGDKVKGAEVLNSLAGLNRGEAWVWSPEAEFGPKRVQFPFFGTFDSFAPPKVRGALPFSKAGWNTVNLDEVKAKLAAVIEEAKANDPLELRKRILVLERQLKSAECGTRSAEQKPAKEVVKEVPVLTKEDVKLIESAVDAYESVKLALGKFSGDAQRVVDPLNKLATTYFQALQGVRVVHPLPWLGKVVQAGPVVRLEVGERNKFRVPAENGNGDAPSGGLKRMMIALAQRPGLNKRQLGVRAGLSSTSGTFGTYLGKLRSIGWIDGTGDAMTLTADGVAALGNYQPLPEGEALLTHWLSELGSGGAGRMLRTLADVYPEALTKEALGVLAEISHTSGTFGTYLGKLRTLELIEGKTDLRAAAEFFE